MRRVLTCIFCGCLLLAASAQGAKQQTELFETYDRYIEGELEHIGVDHRGRLFLSPTVEEFARVKESYLWCVYEEGKESYLVGTGNEGRLYRVRPDQNAQLVFDSAETGIISIEKARNGDIFLGTSPSGTIYRVPRNGTPEIYYNTRQNYVWDLAFLDGDLIASTGPEGRIHRITGKDEGEVYYASPSKHITTMQVREGVIYAGSYEPGHVFKVTDKDEGTVLYDNTHEEINHIAFDDEGRIFFTALNTKSPDPKKRTEHSYVYRIDADGFAEQIWQRENEPIFSFVRHNDDLLVGTSDAGHLYRINADTGDFALVVKDTGSKIVDLRPQDDGSVVMLGSAPGKLFRLGTERAREGTYTSPVIDAKVISRWGRLFWDVVGEDRELPVGFEVRQGNSEKPDDTWTSWSDGQQGQNSLMVGDDASRYLQWRVAFERATEGQVGTVGVFYRTPNRSPRIRSVTVHPQAKGAYDPSIKTGGGSRLSQQLEGGITVTYSVQGRNGNDGKWLPLRGMRTVSWKAFDPDGDELHYRVALQQVGMDGWIPLAEDHGLTYHSFDTSIYPDDEYRIRLQAHDAAGNPKGEETEDEFISDPFRIDNTPPTISDLTVRRGEEVGEYVVTATARDDFNRLITADYSVNQGGIRGLIPEDEIFDSQEETFRFTFTLDEEERGEDRSHILYLRVVDRDENVGVRSVIFP